MPVSKAVALFFLMILLVIIVVAVIAVDAGVWAMPFSNRASSAAFMLAGAGKQFMAAGEVSPSTTSSASTRLARF